MLPARDRETDFPARDALGSGHCPFSNSLVEKSRVQRRRVNFITARGLAEKVLVPRRSMAINKVRQLTRE